MVDGFVESPKSSTIVSYLTYTIPAMMAVPAMKYRSIGYKNKYESEKKIRYLQIVLNHIVIHQKIYIYQIYQIYHRIHHGFSSTFGC